MSSIVNSHFVTKEFQSTMGRKQSIQTHLIGLFVTLHVEKEVSNYIIDFDPLKNTNKTH